MCGICGVFKFKKNNLDLYEKTRLMNQTLTHRGPDHSGIWLGKNNNVSLGHTRLSIIDLNPSSNQPMLDNDNRFVITFNGEIYNYLELKQELVNVGVNFSTNSDTEVLLELYKLEGKKMLSKLDGMFAFAIWDETKQELFCARDRFGEKPFYYYYDGDVFIFASEIKALLSCGINKVISRKKVYEYLLFQTVESPDNQSETFYSNIFQIAPSTYLTFNIEDKKFHQGNYWDLSIQTTFGGTINEAAEKFKDLFFNAVNLRLRSDVKSGSSLSGGLDSSSIVCVANKILSKTTRQHVFSARFPGYIKDEGNFIDLAINSCKNADIIKHEIFLSQESLLKNLNKIFYHQDEPFGSASIAAQFEVMQLASVSGVKVLLDGQGADEVLAGYMPFYDTYLRQLYREDKEKYKLEYSNIKKNSTENIKDLSLKDFARIYLYNTNKLIGGIRRSFLNNDSDYFLNMHPDLIQEYKNVRNPIHAPPNLKEHLKYMLLKRGLNELLRYADRNSMANSVEVRLPFLSHHLVEFVFSLPESYIINGGWTKYLLRTSMNGILPYEIQWRRDKIGYEPPQSDWMKDRQMIELTKSSQALLIKQSILKPGNYDLNWSHLMLGMLYEK
jgi:asparagine synthase (glutamine-hydrolysing)